MIQQPGKIVFENAAFADVIKKAASAAAVRGEALEKAAGILLQSSPDIATFSSTNLELFYREWVNPVSVEGTVNWRMSSQLLSVVAAGLPIGTGREVTLEVQAGIGMCKIVSNRIVCTVPLMEEMTFPEWPTFDPDDLVDIPNFASIISGVEWAASRNSNPPLCGIHFDGEYAVSTDQYRMGIMPCALTVDESFTVPTTVITSLVKANGGGGAKVAYRDGRLLVMPNLYSQMQLVTFGVKYVPFKKILDRRGDGFVRVNRMLLLDMLHRTQPMATIDRNPKLFLWIGKGEIAAQGVSDKGSALGDAIPVPGYANHPRSKYAFSPDLLISAVENAPGSELEIFYYAGNSAGFLTILGEDGYQGWVAARKSMEPLPGSPE